jgi:asparagine synthase (glutamine-hydrolysing)
MLRGAYGLSGEPAGGLGPARHLQETAKGSRRLITQGPLAVEVGSSTAHATVDGISCIFDGALYERDGLAAELDLEGATDAELVVRGFRRHGEALFARLRGRFTLVLWNEAEQRGILCPDLLATQPLFLWRGGGYLAFASELQDLLAMIPSRPGPDPVGFLAYFGGSHVPMDRTLYEGVSRLAPGQLVELTGSWQTRSYWRPSYGRTMKGTQSELAEGLREAVERAIARRISPRSTGVVLSGGLDSSIVTALADRVREPDARLGTYSIVFPGAAYDEAWKIRSLTASIGIEPTLLELDPQGALWLGLDHARRFGLPLMAPGALIESTPVAAAAHDGVEVVLDGQTGDELFGFSPALVSDRLMRGRVLAALELTRRWPGRPTTQDQRRFILKHWGLRGMVPYRLHRFVRRKDPDALSPPWLRRELRGDYAMLEDPWAWKAGPSGPRWWQWLADVLVHGPHGELRLDYLRHRAARAGVLGEPPLYDFDLIDYCLRLPPELAWDPAFTRPLAREAVRGLVPEEVRVQNQKANFSPFCFDILTGADAPGIERLLSAPDAELGAWADMAAVRRLWREERPRQRTGWATTVWATTVWKLAGTECWLRAQADDGFVERMLADPGVKPPNARLASAKGTSTFPAPTFSGLLKAGT